MGTARRSLAVFGATLAAVAGAAGSCTIFNGLTTTMDLSPETGPITDSSPLPETSPPPPSDSSVDAGAPLTYLTLEEAASLCTLVVTCPQITLSLDQSVGVPIDANNFSLCMTWAGGPIPATRLGFSLQQPVLTCIAAATTCAAAGACTVFESLAPTDPRYVACGADGGGGFSGGGYCENAQTAIYCQSGYAQHCQLETYSPGSSCFAGYEGGVSCALGPLDAACPVETTCITSFEDFCGINGLHIRQNCLPLGANCGLLEGGTVNCGLPCSTVGAVTCNGTVAQSCDGYEESPFNCADMGGTCTSNENAVYCTRPSDTCTPLDSDVNVCSGSTISLCVGGQKTTFDCSRIGKTCQPGITPATPHCG